MSRVSRVSRGVEGPRLYIVKSRSGPVLFDVLWCYGSDVCLVDTVKYTRHDTTIHGMKRNKKTM